MSELQISTWQRQEKKCDPLMSVWFSLMYAATGGSTDRPGSRCCYQPSFIKAAPSRSSSASLRWQKCPVKAEQPLSRQKESRQTDVCYLNFICWHISQDSASRALFSPVKTTRDTHVNISTATIQGSQCVTQSGQSLITTRLLFV